MEWYHFDASDSVSHIHYLSIWRRLVRAGERNSVEQETLEVGREPLCAQKIDKLLAAVVYKFSVVPPCGNAYPSGSHCQPPNTSG